MSSKPVWPTGASSRAGSKTTQRNPVSKSQNKNKNKDKNKKNIFKNSFERYQNLDLKYLGSGCIQH